MHSGGWIERTTINLKIYTYCLEKSSSFANEELRDNRALFKNLSNIGLVDSKNKRLTIRMSSEDLSFSQPLPHVYLLKSRNSTKNYHSLNG